MKKVLYPIIGFGSRVGTKRRKNLRNGEAIFAQYPNGERCIAVKNKIGVFRTFDLSCARLAMKFSNGYSDEERY